nr:helix-turn-helix transcriptional regulator [uncultured Caproiciproducens sp.]
MYSFGSLLKQARMTAGFSQVELALKIGIAKSTLSLYESDKREPDVEMIKKISVALEVDPNYLLGIEKTTSQQFSATEVEIIKKYRLLDQRGQQAIEDTLQRELSYIVTNKNMVDMSVIASDAIDTIDKITEAMSKNQHNLVRKK